MLLRVGDAVLADRFPYGFFNVFMLLCRTGRRLFRLSTKTKEQLEAADKHLKSFLPSLLHARLRWERLAFKAVWASYCGPAGRRRRRALM